uniref:NADH-ubiquinone oxidoreductase chain 5 n=1 Tax=Tenuidactylus dadunensis TaxID=3079921 RepID=A0AA96UYD1_9SAUR|nr:NADH dehydrogenase subunit 5 [Tenuidactylus dadunensis]WNX96103.1 NADH dehydrogenase subunit 5 [Tenuidactylus dadunensis]
MISIMLHSTLILTLASLATPLLVSTTTTAIINTTKLATMMSLMPLLLFMNSGMESITTNLHWVNMNFNMQISLTLDLYTIFFTPIALFITWSIMDFTKWYMSSDPALPRFTKFLLLFLMAMLTLTTANNMLQLFIGWEGVGIMSFLLISWWSARTNANTSAMQAVIYNRVGDMGLIMSMAWLAMNLNTWDMQQIFSHTTTHPLPALGLIIAATGKSAQFGLHPWLPAAMEGPTPVSALLHSSTMVVAGIFLLVRMHPLLTLSPSGMTLCLCLGAMTTTFAAICAMTQNDIKKIIAFSTSSQLGLMMLTIGMNQPKLAFLHITTHAFFKAMLFLCAGSIIHNLNDEQDIRKMGGTGKTMPITTTCMTLGSLALAGTPFLAGFYTKDTILETMNTSPNNAWALLITMVATAMTAAYSTRLIIYTQLSTPRYSPYNTPMEVNHHQTAPITRLALGSIVSGWAVTSMTLPNTPQIMTMPPSIKLMAITTTTIGLICATDLAQQTTNFTHPSPSMKHSAATQLGFYNTLTHRQLTTTKMNLAQIPALQLNDALWYEALGPMMMKTSNLLLTKKLSSLHTGNIKTYLLAFTVVLGSCLMLTWT